jgi:hypothetical protein
MHFNPTARQKTPQLQRNLNFVRKYAKKVFLNVGNCSSTNLWPFLLCTVTATACVKVKINPNFCTAPLQYSYCNYRQQNITALHTYSKINARVIGP